MPRFFFDIDDCGDHLPDAEGTVLPDLQNARTEALKTLGEIARYDLPDRPFCDFRISIRDESGSILLRFWLAVQDGGRIQQRPLDIAQEKQEPQRH
jgi:hypothetical protein